MKIYLSDTNVNHHGIVNRVLGDTPRFKAHSHCFLVSYFYMKNLNLPAFLSGLNHPHNFFADSGGFSAYSLGETLTVHEYGEFLLRYHQLIDTYVNLDVKESWRATEANQRYLEGLGLSPIPVYHGGEPISVLRGMIQNYDHIALGGMSGNAGSGSEQMLRFISRCFGEARRAGKAVKFHGFGVTNFRILLMFPWYSVDSTSWSSGYNE